MKAYKYLTCLALAVTSLSACTDLDENLYSEIGSNNYFNTRDDVIAMAFRSFEHGYWTIVPRFRINELPADQLIIPRRDGSWDDGGVWRQFHYHTWTPDISRHVHDEWDSQFAGIAQANFAIDRFNELDPKKFDFQEDEWNALKMQNRVLRCWYYLRLLDAFRNVPFCISYDDPSQNTLSQVPPEKIFNFIEKELTDAIPLLYKKNSLGSGSQYANMWTQAGAAALLVRLYLNAKEYIGVDRLADCEKVAQDIVDGVYGEYKVADRWDAPFDSDNDSCDELLFFFSGSCNYTSWHYNQLYNWGVPSYSELFFDDAKVKHGGHNGEFVCLPSYDPTGNLYDFKLGMTIQKFRKYPGDVRLKKYKNLGGGKREGMFLFGYLEYMQNGIPRKLKAPEMPYELCIRDAVGQFHYKKEGQWLTSPESNMTTGDYNSGWYTVKYPMYSNNDPGAGESDFAEIRLPEIIYALAECKLRRGDDKEAGKLLNSVRRRYYPSDKHKEVLYQPEGNITLDLDEMLDEWGREFLAEGRRRIDLIRFDKFNKGTWWDKQPDADDHTKIYPVPRVQITTNAALKQNPGYK